MSAVPMLAAVIWGIGYKDRKAKRTAQDDPESS
jgi:hypothetical protein